VPWVSRLKDLVVLVNDLNPNLILLSSLLRCLRRRSLTTQVNDLSLLLAHDVESCLWIHLAQLVDEDAMREVLLKALVGSFEELQQLGHPEDPEPGGHLVDVGVDELTDSLAFHPRCRFGAKQVENVRDHETRLALHQSDATEIAFERVLN
jgi:hypothetical protein